MKIFLIIIALILLTAPVIFWTFLSAMGCAYTVNVASCGVSIRDFWDPEFLAIAFIPWGIALLCLFGVYRKRTKTPNS